MSRKKPDPVDIAVGQQIKIARLNARLSQTQLAEEIGVTFQQVQKYEKGVNRVGAGRLTRIAKVLGVSVSSFFDEKNIGTSTIEQGRRPPLELISEPLGYRMLYAFAEITERDVQRAIIELVEQIVGTKKVKKR